MGDIAGRQALTKWLSELLWLEDRILLAGGTFKSGRVDACLAAFVASPANPDFVPVRICVVGFELLIACLAQGHADTEQLSAAADLLQNLCTDKQNLQATLALETVFGRKFFVAVLAAQIAGLAIIGHIQKLLFAGQLAIAKCLVDGRRL